MKAKNLLPIHLSVTAWAQTLMKIKFSSAECLISFCLGKHLSGRSFRNKRLHTDSSAWTRSETFPLSYASCAGFPMQTQIDGGMGFRRAFQVVQLRPPAIISLFSPPVYCHFFFFERHKSTIKPDIAGNHPHRKTKVNEKKKKSFPAVCLALKKLSVLRNAGIQRNFFLCKELSKRVPKPGSTTKRLPPGLQSKYDDPPSHKMDFF